MSMTTTSNHFPVVDITHKPKRMQGDMIKLKEAEMGITESTTESVEPLSVVTLERAISYYKRMSSDATNGKLYTATAQWLEELLVIRTPKTKAEVKAVVEGENNNGDNSEAK